MLDYDKRKRKLEVDLKSNKPNKRQKAYAKFHFENIGYYWTENTTGKKLSKSQLFNKFFKDAPRKLELLTRNTHPHYQRILKSSFEEKWIDGIQIAKRIGLDDD